MPLLFQIHVMNGALGYQAFHIHAIFATTLLRWVFLTIGETGVGLQPCDPGCVDDYTRLGDYPGQLLFMTCTGPYLTFLREEEALAPSEHCFLHPNRESISYGSALGQF